MVTAGADDYVRLTGVLYSQP